MGISGVSLPNLDPILKFTDTSGKVGKEQLCTCNVYSQSPDEYSPEPSLP